VEALPDVRRESAGPRLPHRQAFTGRGCGGHRCWNDRGEAHGPGARDVNHLRGDIWQIEIDGRSSTYRLLFAKEGRYHQVLLALEMVNKKWQKAKGRHIDLAEQRLADWRERGARQKLARSASGPSPR
jgi:hypothetical protein